LEGRSWLWDQSRLTKLQQEKYAKRRPETERRMIEDLGRRFRVGGHMSLKALRAEGRRAGREWR
jgi:hypothetical protein